jgi:predicted nucleic acid-binding protein
MSVSFERGISMLFDTDVLIWFLRGNAQAAKAIDAEPVRSISIVTYMELVQGARSRQELRQIKDFLSDAVFQTIPLSDGIGHRASIYVEEYGLGTSLGVVDALIAATVVERNDRLCTGNFRHYRPIKELEIKEFRP